MATSAVTAHQSPAALEAERVVIAMKKQQDAAEAQAMAMVQLIQDANVGTRLSVYA